MPGIAFAAKVGGRATRERLTREWRRTYRPLRVALYDLATHAKARHGLSCLTITCLMRTEDENDALPNSNPDSLHLIEHGTRAADMRIWGMSQAVRDELVDYWKSRNPVGFDLIDEGNHLHAEVDHRFVDEEKFLAERGDV